MKKLTVPTLLLPLAAASFFLTACGEKSPASDAATDAVVEKNYPEAPDEAIRYILDGLAEGNGSTIWEAMPASYQSDVVEVVQLAGTKLDAELYNQTFALIGRLGTVLDKQQEFVFNTSLMGQSPDPEQIARTREAWPSIVNLIEVLTTSSVASAEGLQGFEGKAFFDQTVSPMLADIDALSKLQPESDEPTLSDLKKAEIKLIENTGTEATIEISMPEEEVETETFVKVEERWVPAEMAGTWEMQMAEAKAQLEGIDPDQMAQQKPQFLGVIGMIDGVLTQIEAAETQQQFDQAVQGAMMPLMGAAMMFQGMGGETEAPAMPAMPTAP